MPEIPGRLTVPVALLSNPWILFWNIFPFPELPFAAIPERAMLVVAPDVVVRLKIVLPEITWPVIVAEFKMPANA
jgi:hypothetical protein